ncbi:CRISPR-associated endonuclease Cas1 [Arhodomonas sp. AD133]|uniref:CRISPR-associated endonuclease Cas1 n=1 Tax=Arhodomonas sp. AD133 TaxID=3415009 RepID=UPI003EBC972E
MGTLYLDRRGTRLDFDRGALVVREPEAPPRSVPVSMLERVIIIGGASVSANLLTHLAEQGTSVTIMPGRGHRRSTFLHGLGHGDVARRLGQYRLVTEGKLKALWAQRIVWLRMAGQRRLLSAALQYRQDRRRPLFSAIHELRQAMVATRVQGLSVERLRGHEGAATAAFFRGYQTLFPAELGFTQRNRRPPRDPVNAALSLAYTLVHGDALRAIAASGLEPMMGVLHEPSYGRESLACDLTEIARCRAERLVWRLFAERTLEGHDFVRAQRAVMLGKSGRGVFFRAYEHAAVVHRRWLFRTAQRFARECSALSDISDHPRE